jgi:hypothetical protein
VLLQLVGAVPLLAYPMLLVGIPFAAGVLRGREAAEFGLLLAVPVIWMGLWAVSWILLARRLTVLAFAISALPACGAVMAGSWFLRYKMATRATMTAWRERDRQEAEAAGAVNPVAGALMSMRGDRSAWPRVKRVIEGAEPALLSKPVPQFGSPLRIALTWNGTDFPQAARLLVARGARMTSEEQILWPNAAWNADVIARGITLPDAAAQQENPLVWRIVNAPGRPVSWEDEQPFLALVRQRPELLNKETRGYGTPLHAALLMQYDGLADTLAREGAILSKRERAMPALAHQVAQFLAAPDHAGGKIKYETAVAREDLGIPR